MTGRRPPDSRSDGSRRREVGDRSTPSSPLWLQTPSLDHFFEGVDREVKIGLTCLKVLLCALPMKR